jgi:ATP adenylyltransferase
LTICELPPHHVAVLNKYNVLEDHVLVITRGFVHQESALTADDFSAVATGLRGGCGLAFYNAGRTAGASQPHKHFQLVPLPLGRKADIPVSVLFHGAPDGADTIGGLRFRHAFGLLHEQPEDCRAFGLRCHDLYQRFLAALGLAETFDRAEEARLPPYNLLLTNRWLFMAPRTAEHYRGVSVNGLGYAGSLFVSSQEKLKDVESIGPMKFLEKVSVVRP